MIASRRAGVDQGVFLQAFDRVPAGVAVVAAMARRGPIGIVAASLAAVSSAPALVSVSGARDSADWRGLRATTSVGISLLGADHLSEARQLASGGPDQFTGVDCIAYDSGAVRIVRAVAYFECALWSEVGVGANTLAIFEVRSLEFDELGEPLVAHDGRFKALGA